MDESIGENEVLRTEMLLAEAFGLPVLTVLGPQLTGDDQARARVMKRLCTADLTYRRLTDVQAFHCDEASLANLSKRIRQIKGSEVD